MTKILEPAQIQPTKGFWAIMYMSITVHGILAKIILKKIYKVECFNQQWVLYSLVCCMPLLCLFLNIRVLYFHILQWLTYSTVFALHLNSLLEFLQYTALSIMSCFSKTPLVVLFIFFLSFLYFICIFLCFESSDYTTK